MCTDGKGPCLDYRLRSFLGLLVGLNVDLQRWFNADKGLSF